MNRAHWKTLDQQPSRIIAHRGASGYWPEHSRQAYELAFAQGADAVEPDVLPSRDGVLMVRHDIDLAPTTDIAQRAEFAMRAKRVAGQSQWRIGEFDAHEIASLRCMQPNPARVRVEVASRVLRLADLLAMARAAQVEVELEIKDSAYFRRLGLDVVALLECALRDAGMLGADSPVWLEGADHAVLRALHARCGNRCVALIEAPLHAAAAAHMLRELAPWASAMAPAKRTLWDAAGNDSGLVADAHAAGLQVHAWTFRDDGDCTPFASPRAELEAAFALGVDALFCDFPDTALAARAQFRPGRD